MERWTRQAVRKRCLAAQGDQRQAASNKPAGGLPGARKRVFDQAFGEAVYDRAPSVPDVDDPVHSSLGQLGRRLAG